MSWIAASMKKYLSGEQFESLEERLNRFRLGDHATGIQPIDRVTQLEDDLARALLLIHVLAEACVRKGIFTSDEINEVAKEIDLLDGIEDGKLDPSVVRPRDG